MSSSEAGDHYVTDGVFLTNSEKESALHVYLQHGGVHRDSLHAALAQLGLSVPASIEVDRFFATGTHGAGGEAQFSALLQPKCWLQLVEAIWRAQHCPHMYSVSACDVSLASMSSLDGGGRGDISTIGGNSPPAHCDATARRERPANTPTQQQQQHAPHPSVSSLGSFTHEGGEEEESSGSGDGYDTPEGASYGDSGDLRNGGVGALCTDPRANNVNARETDEGGAAGFFCSHRNTNIANNSKQDREESESPKVIHNPYHNGQSGNNNYNSNDRSESAKNDVTVKRRLFQSGSNSLAPSHVEGESGGGTGSTRVANKTSPSPLSPALVQQQQPGSSSGNRRLVKAEKKESDRDTRTGSSSSAKSLKTLFRACGATTMTTPRGGPNMAENLMLRSDMWAHILRLRADEMKMPPAPILEHATATMGALAVAAATGTQAAVASVPALRRKLLLEGGRQGVGVAPLSQWILLHSDFQQLLSQQVQVVKAELAEFGIDMFSNSCDTRLDSTHPPHHHYNYHPYQNCQQRRRLQFSVSAKPAPTLAMVLAVLAPVELAKFLAVSDPSSFSSRSDAVAASATVRFLRSIVMVEAATEGAFEELEMALADHDRYAAAASSPFQRSKAATAASVAGASGAGSLPSRFTFSSAVPTAAAVFSSSAFSSQHHAQQYGNGVHGEELQWAGEDSRQHQLNQREGGQCNSNSNGKAFPPMGRSINKPGVTALNDGGRVLSTGDTSMAAPSSAQHQAAELHPENTLKTTLRKKRVQSRYKEERPIDEITASVVARARARRLIDELRKNTIPINRFEWFVRAEIADVPMKDVQLSKLLPPPDHSSSSSVSSTSFCSESRGSSDSEDSDALSFGELETMQRRSREQGRHPKHVLPQQQHRQRQSHGDGDSSPLFKLGGVPEFAVPHAVRKATFERLSRPQCDVRLYRTCHSVRPPMYAPAPPRPGSFFGLASFAATTPCFSTSTRTANVNRASGATTTAAAAAAYVPTRHGRPASAMSNNNSSAGPSGYTTPLMPRTSRSQHSKYSDRGGGNSSSKPPLHKHACTSSNHPPRPSTLAVVVDPRDSISRKTRLSSDSGKRSANPKHISRALYSSYVPTAATAAGGGGGGTAAALTAVPRRPASGNPAMTKSPPVEREQQQQQQRPTLKMELPSSDKRTEASVAAAAAVPASNVAAVPVEKRHDEAHKRALGGRGGGAAVAAAVARAVAAIDASSSASSLFSPQTMKSTTDSIVSAAAGASTGRSIIRVLDNSLESEHSGPLRQEATMPANLAAAGISGSSEELRPPPVTIYERGMGPQHGENCQPSPSLARPAGDDDDDNTALTYVTQDTLGVHSSSSSMISTPASLSADPEEKSERPLPTTTFMRSPSQNRIKHRQHSPHHHNRHHHQHSSHSNSCWSLHGSPLGGRPPRSLSASVKQASH